MPYPTSWRPGSRPSAGARAAVMPAPWSFPVGGRLPRFRPPRFTPGHHVPGLMLAFVIWDTVGGAIDFADKGGLGAVSAINDYDMTGWTHLCGPVPPPATYGFPILNRWTVALAAGWNGGAGPGVCGLANQSIAGQLLQPAAGVRARYRWWSKLSGTGAGTRFAVAEEWGRNPAGVTPMALSIPVAAIDTIHVPGVTAPPPPLTPVITAPIPLTLAPSVIAPSLPESPDRGYLPPPIIVTPPRDRPYSDGVVRVLPIGPDVVSPHFNPEQKVPVNSRAGFALTQAFRLLSLYGTSQAFITALWNALPSWARTPHARNADKLRDLAQNWGSLDLGEAFANSLLAGVRTALAGAMYGAATDTLTSTFGEGLGFGLYRAWATGEFAYSSGSGFDPHRWNRGGGSVNSNEISPPIADGTTAWQRARWRASARQAVREARRERREHAQEWHRSPYERFVKKRLARYLARRREARARGARIRRRRIAWMKARGF